MAGKKSFENADFYISELKSTNVKIRAANGQNMVILWTLGARFEGKTAYNESFTVLIMFI